MDRIVGGETLTPTAEKVRRLMHYGQFFSRTPCTSSLCSPICSSVSTPTGHRNVIGVAAKHRDLAVQG